MQHSIKEKKRKLSKSSLSRAEKKVQRKRCRSKEYDTKISSYMRLLCELCNEEVPTFSALQQHFLSVHSQKGYMVCCNKKLYKRVLLVDHINRHINPEYFKYNNVIFVYFTVLLFFRYCRCKDCNKTFSDKQCLRNHILIMHQPDEDKAYQCEHCPKKFVKRYLLEQHIPIHVPTEERRHICEICNKP